MSVERQIKRQAELEKTQEDRSLQDRLASLEKERKKEVEDLQGKQRIAETFGLGEESTAYQKLIDATNTRYEAIKNGEKAVSDIRKDGIEQLKEQNLILESQNRLISALEGLAKSLGDAFGDGIGKFVGNFANLAKVEADFTDKSTKLFRNKEAEKEIINLQYSEDEAARKRV